MDSRRDLQNKSVLDPTFFDRDNAFMLYATFCGDLERTAHALGVRPADVLEVATADNWNEKLRGILELKKSTRPGDIERAINRALNFVQAARFRHVVERAIRKLYKMEDKEFEDLVLKSVTKEGQVESRMSTKGLADLAAALEKCQSLTYQALNDTAPERAKRKAVEDDGQAAQDLHLQIADAMGKVRSSNSVRAELFDQQLEAAQHLVDSKAAQ